MNTVESFHCKVMIENVAREIRDEQSIDSRSDFDTNGALVKNQM